MKENVVLSTFEKSFCVSFKYIVKDYAVIIKVTHFRPGIKMY